MLIQYSIPAGSPFFSLSAISSLLTEVIVLVDFLLGPACFGVPVGFLLTRVGTTGSLDLGSLGLERMAR